MAPTDRAVLYIMNPYLYAYIAACRPIICLHAIKGTSSQNFEV